MWQFVKKLIDMSRNDTLNCITNKTPHFKSVHVYSSNAWAQTCVIWVVFIQCTQKHILNVIDRCVLWDWKWNNCDLIKVDVTIHCIQQNCLNTLCLNIWNMLWLPLWMYHVINQSLLLSDTFWCMAFNYAVKGWGREGEGERERERERENSFLVVT